MNADLCQAGIRVFRAVKMISAKDATLLSNLRSVDVTSVSFGSSQVRSVSYRTIRRHRRDQDIVVMHDGQPSLWNCSRSFQEGWKTIDILDLLHVLPRIWSAAKIIQPSEVEQYVKGQLFVLLSGGVGLMITAFRNYKNRKGVTKAEAKELDQIINYLDANRSRMKYDEYLAKGLPIATGFIEGACRHVIKDRMERSGMRWKEKGAQSILNLRCIEASELWDVVTEQHRVVSLSKFGKHRKNYCDDFLTMAS